MLTNFQVEKPRSDSGEMNPIFLPLSVARMIWKKKWAIAGIAVAGCALTAFVVRRMPSIYVSEALVLIDPQKIPEKFVPSTVSSELQDRIASINQEILSSSRLEKIIAEFDLYREERKELFPGEVRQLMRNDISIQMERGGAGNKPGAFRVAYQGKDPKMVARVANRIANLYIERNVKTREGQAEGTSEFLGRQLAEAKTRLDELEAALSRFKLKYNGELPEQQGALISTLARLQVELESNRDALNRAQESRAILQSNLASGEASLHALAAVSGRMEEPAQPAAFAPVAAPPRRSAALQAQLNALALRYGPAHPDVKRLEAELAAEQAVEAAEPGPEPVLAPREPARERPAPPNPTAASGRPEAADQLASLKLQIGVAEREIAFRTSEQARIEGEMQEANRRIGRLPLREQEMAQVTRDYEISKTNYRNLLDKKLAAEMATDLEHGQKPERFTLLDPAPVPERPQRPRRALFYSFGSLLSMMLGLAAGIGMEIRQGRLLGQWELRPEIPILARVPRIVATRAVAG